MLDPKYGYVLQSTNQINEEINDVRQAGSGIKQIPTMLNLLTPLKFRLNSTPAQNTPFDTEGGFGTLLGNQNQGNPVYFGFENQDLTGSFRLKWAFPSSTWDYLISLANQFGPPNDTYNPMAGDTPFKGTMRLTLDGYPLQISINGGVTFGQTVTIPITSPNYSTPVRILVYQNSYTITTPFSPSY